VLWSTLTVSISSRVICSLPSRMAPIAAARTMCDRLLISPPVRPDGLLHQRDDGPALLLVGELAGASQHAAGGDLLAPDTGE